jgi:hypothetical protein
LRDHGADGKAEDISFGESECIDENASSCRSGESCGKQRKMLVEVFLYLSKDRLKLPTGWTFVVAVFDKAAWCCALALKAQLVRCGILARGTSPNSTTGFI